MNNGRCIYLFFITLTILTCFTFLPSYAQQPVLIKGKITDTLGTALQGVSITITTEEQQVLAFAISNKTGEYSVNMNTGLSPVVLNVRKLNYKPIRQVISAKSQELNFTLLFFSEILPEVKIKSGPIRMRGDTISYQVSEFAEGRDRSIGDVLAKMPGIEIQGDGKVLYQGKPINRYYIEGMDLLEGRYGLANKNLPHQSVTSVQVIENHQPVKVLDSLIPSNQAAINIKLKNTITTTGNAQLGAGFSPFLWSANVTPMVFTKKHQFIASYQANNIGNDVSVQLKTLNLENFLEQIETPTTKSNLVGIVEVQFPPVSNQRFLDNNIHLGTINYITKLKRELELRINTSYYNDFQRQRGGNRIEYILPTGNVLLEEQMNNRLFYNDFKTSVTLQKNAAKGYLSNNTRFHLNTDGATGHVLNTNNNITQRTSTPYTSFSNELKWITPIGKQLITIYSFINYNQSPQRLTITPGQFIEALNDSVDYGQLRQEIRQQVWQTHNYAEFTKGVGKFTLTAKAGMVLQEQKTDADIYIDNIKSSDHFNNALLYKKQKAFIQTELIRKTQKSDLTIRFPFSYTHIAVRDSRLEHGQKNGGLIIQPSVTWRYKLSNYWESDVFAGFGNDFYQPGQVLYGYLLTNYRNLQQNAYPVLQNKTIYLQPAIRFRNPVSGVFSNIRYRFSFSDNPFLFQHLVQPDGTMQVAIKNVTNKAYRQELSSKLGYYLTGIKTTLTIGADLSRQSENQWLNNGLTETVNTTVNPNLRINTRFSAYASIDYTINNTIGMNKTGTRPKQQYYTLSQAGRLTLYPLKDHQLTVIADHYYNDFVPANKHNVYWDLSYRYSIVKKRIDFDLVCINLLNASSYVRPMFTQFYFSQNIVQLRPRQLMLKVSFYF
jgi:hypothetical protein